MNSDEVRDKDCSMHFPAWLCSNGRMNPYIVTVVVRMVSLEVNAVKTSYNEHSFSSTKRIFGEVLSTTLINSNLNYHKQI